MSIQLICKMFASQTRGYELKHQNSTKIPHTWRLLAVPVLGKWAQKGAGVAGQQV